jgi:hypothetical protein
MLESLVDCVPPFVWDELLETSEGKGDGNGGGVGY